MQNVDSLDRNACRQVAVDRFSPDRLAADYVELYDRTIEATRDAAIATAPLRDTQLNHERQHHSALAI